MTLSGQFDFAVIAAPPFHGHMALTAGAARRSFPPRSARRARPISRYRVALGGWVDGPRLNRWQHPLSQAANRGMAAARE